MSMQPFKILVPVKRVVDPWIKIHVKGGKIDTKALKHAINPFDSIAIEEALRLREYFKNSQVIAATIGCEKSLETLHTALGMGADRAIHILTKEGESLMPLGVAKILEKIVKEEQCSLAIVGKQAIDNDYGQTGSMLASLLRWPQASFATKVEPLGSKLKVTTEVDFGLRTLEMPLPGVIITELGLNTPRYVSLANMIKAKKKPVQTVQIAEVQSEEIKPLEVLEVSAPESRPPCEFVNSVDELLEKLRSHSELKGILP